MAETPLRPPIPNSYVVPGTRLAAGEYPGSPPGTSADTRARKLDAFLAAGITAFVDLTAPEDRLAPYADGLRDAARRRGLTVSYERFPVPDMGVCSAEHMRAALDAVDAHLAAGRGVYVHCWGGIGRTGTAVGAWLVRHGRAPEDALAEVQRLYDGMTDDKQRRHPRSPQTAAQRRFVRDWGAQESAARRAEPRHRRDADARSRVERLAPGRAVATRVRGCLLGTAVGDALGWPVEFESLSAIRARYGPAGIQEFDARAPGGLGAVTDDTQLTLFTAEGVLRTATRCVEHWAMSDTTWQGEADRRHIFHPGVMWYAYQRWLRTQGERGRSDADPFTGEYPGWLFGVPALQHRRAPGTTCLSALRGPAPDLEFDPRPRARAANRSKGCGGVMRVAPIGCVVCEDAFTYAAGAAALTHGHPSGYLSAGAYAHMLQLVVHDGAPLREAAEDALARLTEWPGHEETSQAVRRALALAAGPGEPTAEHVERLGAGWTGEEALAIGLYAALVARDFAHGVRLAVNHSGDSDSTGSIAGGLLGAALGEYAIPADWRETVELREVLRAVADDLVLGYGGGDAWRARYPGN